MPPGDARPAEHMSGIGFVEQRERVVLATRRVQHVARSTPHVEKRPRCVSMSLSERGRLESPPIRHRFSPSLWAFAAPWRGAHRRSTRGGLSVTRRWLKSRRRSSPRSRGIPRGRAEQPLLLPRLPPAWSGPAAEPGLAGKPAQCLRYVIVMLLCVSCLPAFTALHAVTSGRPPPVAVRPFFVRARSCWH
jgi:hypothetical protein